MKIVYHHFESDKPDWWTSPPELICSQKTEHVILKLWHLFCGKDAYVTDPLSHTQLLYYILRWNIPFSKLIIPFIKKEHIHYNKDFIVK